MNASPDEGVVIAAGTVRGTQSFVHVLSQCWKRPLWTGLEVLWRWIYGIPALAVLWYWAMRIFKSTPLDTTALKHMSLVDPMATAKTLTDAMVLLLPPVMHLLAWLGPLMVAIWVVVSAIGRTVVLRRVDGTLHSRMGTLIVLQGVRVVALLGSFAAWFAGMRWAAKVNIAAPLAAGGEPNLVGYFAAAIVGTLFLFCLWAIASWGLSVAPLLAMLRDIGVAKSFAAAFRLGPLKSKLMEINLVMGIVKIALIVLAMVLSATPLPFEAVATQQFLMWWWAGITVLYFVASDFFHVARLVAYLELWRAYDGSAGSSLR